jgi:hypothetical protein
MRASEYRHTPLNGYEAGQVIRVLREALAVQSTELDGRRRGALDRAMTKLATPEASWRRGHRVVRCGHLITEQEWRDGWRTCENCPPDAVPSTDPHDVADPDVDGAEWHYRADLCPACASSHPRGEWAVCARAGDPDQ